MKIDESRDRPGHREAGGRVGESDGERVTACTLLLFVDCVARGLCELERWHIRRRDGDRFSDSGVASLTCDGASDGEAPEPRNGYRPVPCERDGDGGNTAPTIRSEAALNRGGLGGDARDELGLVHVVLLSSCGWTSEDEESQIKRAACGKGTQPAVRESA